MKLDRNVIPAAQTPDGLTFPNPAQNFPGEHGSHWDADINPTLLLNVPGGHWYSRSDFVPRGQ